MRPQRLSEFKTGDTVRVKGNSWQGGSSWLTPGTLGTLGHLYRVQDGFEVWQFWVHWKLYGVIHTEIEPCYGPIQRPSK